MPGWQITLIAVGAALVAAIAAVLLSRVWAGRRSVTARADRLTERTRDDEVQREAPAAAGASRSGLSACS